MLYLHSRLFVNGVFAKKNFMFSVISNVISRVFVKCSSSIVLLRRSGRASRARFYPSVQIMCKFGNFISMNWNL